MLLHARNRCRRLCQRTVYFTTRRVGHHPVADQLAQRLPFQTQLLRHQQPRDHSAVAIGKIAEIVVCAHFATINGIFVAHPLFDKRVPGFDITGLPPAAVTTSTVFQDRRGSWIILPRILLQKRLRQQADNVVALNELTFSSNRKQRSKSPSKAIPISAPCSITALRVSARHSGSRGLGIPLGSCHPACCEF